MDGDGPVNGRVINANVIVAGENPFAVDTVTARILGFKDEKIDYIKKEKTGKIEVLGEKIESINIKTIKPKNFYIKLIPQFVADIFGKLIWIRPEILENCTKCERCLKNCPVNAIYYKKGKLKIDYSKCIKCLCCYEGCTYEAIGLKESLLTKIFIKRR